MLIAYLLACVIAVALIFIYTWGSRHNYSYKPLSAGARCVCFVVLTAIGAGILWHVHGALESGQILCGRYSSRRVCTQEDDALWFSLRWLFLFMGGACGVAVGIFLLVRPDPAGESG